MRFCLTFFVAFSLTFQNVFAANVDIRTQKEFVTRYLKSAGLNGKNRTYKDLDLFLSVHLPADTYKIYSPKLKKMGTKKLPSFSVSTITNSEGLEAVKLVLTDEGKTTAVELNPNRLQSMSESALRVDGVSLSMNDILNPQVAQSKYFQKYPNKKSSLSKSSSTFDNPYADNSSYGGNFLIPDKNYWKQMTPEQKANFIIELRQLWIASQKVREAFAKDSSATLLKKTNESFASLNPRSSYDKIEVVLRLIMGEAQANQFGGPSKSSLLISTSGKNYCINLGLVGKTISNRCVHPSKLNDKEIKNDPLLISQKKLANSSGCDQGSSACNPNLYFDIKRNTPICVSQGTANIGKNGTHYGGECEINSPLFPPRERNFGQDIEDMFKVDPSSVTPELLNKIRAEMMSKNGSVEKNAELLNYLKEFTEKFIKSKTSNSEDDSFSSVVNAFYNDINRDLSVCKTMFAGGVFNKIKIQKEKGSAVDASTQIGACHALLKRKLSFDIGLGQLCPRVFAKKGATNSDLSLIDQPSSYPADIRCDEAIITPPPTTNDEKVSEVVSQFEVKCIDVNGATIQNCKEEQNALPGAVVPPVKESSFTCGPYTLYCTGPALLAAYLLLRDDDKDKKKSASCPPGSTPVGIQCFKTASCPTGSTDVNGVCVKPGICTDGSIMVNGACTFNCPTGMVKNSNGICMIQYFCPGTNKSVTSLTDCSEGTTGTTGGGSVGGVPTTK